MGLDVRVGAVVAGVWLAVLTAGCAGERVEEASAAPVAQAQHVEAGAVVQRAEPDGRLDAAVVAADRAVALGAFAARLEARRDRFGGALAASALGARWRLGHNGLPRNVRQTAEGYWIGAEPALEHLSELHARGVRVVVSGTRLGQAARELFEQLEMRHVDVPFGGRFPSHATLLEGTREYGAEQIFIHCEHGGDRSGAMLAFLLTAREGWPAARALLAVVHPSEGDIRRLTAVMRESGVRVDDAEAERYAGIYSAERNGGFGGLKVRGDSYVKLVRTTLHAMRSAGAL